MNSGTLERIENSDSGNTSTEDLLVVNNLATSLDTTEMARVIRVPRGRSFLEESSSEEISERLLRTFMQDVPVIDETFESLLEKSFNESREEAHSFLSAASQSWRMPVNSLTLDDNSSSAVFENTSLEVQSYPRLTCTDTLREEVYFEQPFTLVNLGENNLFLHHMGLGTEDHIRFPGETLRGACVLPDGQIIATGGNTPSKSYRYQTSTGWTVISGLLWPRVGHAMVFHKGTIYVIGGQFQNQPLREVERLTNSSHWEEFVPLNNARVGPAAVSMQSKLYVVGGIREIPNFASIEVLIENSWAVLEVQIPNLLHGHGCFFTPEHQLIMLGGFREGSASKLMSVITEEEGIVYEEEVMCEDWFPLNSWSYFEEDSRVLIWGAKALWNFDVNSRVLGVYRTWSNVILLS